MAEARFLTIEPHGWNIFLDKSWDLNSREIIRLFVACKRERNFFRASKSSLLSRRSHAIVTYLKFYDTLPFMIIKKSTNKIDDIYIHHDILIGLINNVTGSKHVEW